MFEVKSVTVDNGGKIKTEYELYLNGLLIGTSKLHCDAVLLGKQLDRELKLAYHLGCAEARIGNGRRNGPTL